MDSKFCVLLLALLFVVIAGGSNMEAPSATTTSMMGTEAVHRRILGSTSASSLDQYKAVCIKSCPAPGRPYTGRGSCLKVYQCPDSA